MMAGGQSDYTRGDMEIKAQRGTFDGFMVGTIYGGAALVVILLFPILMFAVHLGWLPSLIVSVVVGIIIGMALKLKGAWYASLIGLGLVTGIVSFIFSLF